MVSVIRAMSVVAAILCLPGVAGAGIGAPSQEQSGQAVSAGRSPAASADAVPAIDHKLFTWSAAPRNLAGPPAPRSRSAAASRRQDSLWNGVLVGAGLGALLGAVGGTALLECSECAGFNVPLTFGVIGAGVGAAVGAGIDALRHTRSPIPATAGRVTVAPQLGKGRRAVVAQVRF